MPPSSPAPDPFATVRRLLADPTLCPACAQRLTGSRCGACGLDVAGEQGSALWELSLAARDALARRDEHVAVMRSEQAAFRAAQAAREAARYRAAVEARDAIAAESLAQQRALRAGAERQSRPESVMVHDAATGGGPARTTGPVAGARIPAAARPTAPRAPRPRWRVQTVLQVTGSILLAAASIVFLLFSWGWLGLAGRAIAVAVGTVVVFGLASHLRRARLGSSAEAVGGLAAVLLLLDAWAVHATGLVRPAEPAAYAAAACLVCAVVLIAWGHASRLRVGTLTGAALVPLSPVLLVPLASSTAGAVWCLVAAVALASGRCWLPADGGRVVLAVAAWLGTLVGAVLSVSTVATVAVRIDGGAGTGRSGWPAVAALGALSALGALQTARALPGASRWSRLDRPTWWAICTGTTLAAAFLGAGVAAVAWLGAAPATLAWLPTLAAGLVVVGLRAPGTRRRRGPDASAAPMPDDLDRVGDAAALVTLSTVVPSLVLLPLTTFVATFEPASASFAVPVTGAVAVAAGLLTVTGRTPRTTRTAHAAASWLAVAVVLAAPASLATVVPVLAGAGVLTLLLAVSVAAYVVDRTPRARGRRGPLRAVATLGPLLAVLAAQGDPLLGAVATGGVALLMVAVHGWVSGRTGLRAAAIVGTGLASWASAMLVTVAAEVPAPLGVLVVGAVGLAATAPAAVSGRLAWARRDRQAALVTALMLAALGWSEGAGALGLPDTPGGTGVLAVLVALLATASAWAVAARSAAPLGRTGRFVAGAALAPCGAATLTSLHTATGGRAALALAVGIAAVGVAAVLLAPLLSVATADDRTVLDEWLRRTVELSGWCTTLVALVASAGAGPGPTALVLAVAATAAGAWALQADRRAARWVALGLAVAASWVLLVADGVGTPEAYLAPLGVVLATIGGYRWRRGTGDDVPLLAAGLGLVAIPVAVLDGTVVDGGPSRAALALVLAGLVVVAGTWAVRRPGERDRAPRVADESPAAAGLRAPQVSPAQALLGLGLAVALLGPARHAFAGAVGGSVERSPAVLERLLAVEAWSWPAGLLVAVGAAGLAARWVQARTWGPWLTLIVAAAPSLLGVDASPLGLTRWSTMFGLGALLAVPAARAVGRSGSGTGTAPAADTGAGAGAGAGTRMPSPDVRLGLGLALAAGAALVGSLASGPLPADLPLALLGILVTTTGAQCLRRTGAAVRWPVLGPLLLVPTVLSTSGAWRAPLATALAAVLVVVGARLRAPGHAPRPTPGAASIAAGEPDARAWSTGAVHARLLLVGSGMGVALLGPELHALLGAMSTTGTPRVLDVELWSLAAAAIVLGGGLALSGRRPLAVPDPSGWVPWLLAGVVAAPTLVAVDAGTAGLVRWSVVFAAAGACALAGARTRSSAGTRAVAIGLVVGAIAAASASANVLLTPEVPAALLGLLVTATAVLHQRRTDAFVAWSPLGPVLLVPAAVQDSAAWSAPATLAVAGLLVAVALRAAPAPRPVLDTGTGTGTAANEPPGTDPGHSTEGWVVAQRFAAVTGAGLGALGAARTALVAATASGPAPGLGDVELWSLAAAAIVAGALLALARVWPTGGLVVHEGPALWGLPVVLALVSVPTLLASDVSALGLARAGALFAVGSALAVEGALAEGSRTRLDRADPSSVVAGRRRRVAGLVLAVSAALVAATRAGADPADLPIVLAGALLLGAGLLAARASDGSSWRSLGPGLVVTLGVPLSTGWLEPTAWRLVLVLVGAAAAVVLGAVHRRQAPFVLGAGALVLIAVLQLSPAAATAMRGLEWWVVLAAGGAVLLGLGLTYERRLREATEAVRFVAGMR